MSVSFKDGGRSWHSRREKLLRLDGRALEAKSRQTLRRGAKAPKPVYVLSGPKAFGQLPHEQAQQLRAFSDRIIPHRGQGIGSEVGAWKSRVLSGNSHSVAWDLGPVAVLPIGSFKSTPVCVTPVQVPRPQGALFRDRAADDLILLDALDEHLVACLEEYMSDVADLLLGAFFRKKDYALRVARKVEQTIETSVRQKLQFLNGAGDAEPRVRTRKLEVRHRYENELALYSAAASVANAAAACLRFCGGEERDWRAFLQEADHAVASLPEEVIEKGYLQKCLGLLQTKPAFDELSPLSPTDPAPNDWMSDLLLACRFLSETSHLLQSQVPSIISIFVSHHMDVGSSELFYSSLEDFANTEFTDRFVFWTGKGRQQHIQLAILAKLWLSDVQLLYLPNSLVTYHGIKKPLKKEADWVIEEIAYGALLEKPFHCVIADGSDDVRREFRDQLTNYQWTTLRSSFRHLPLRLGPEDFRGWGKDLISNMETHLRERIFTVHHPGSHLSSEDRGRLTRACLNYALKKRLSSMIWGLRLGILRDRWKVIQALAEASKAHLKTKGELGVTAEEVLEALGSYTRADGRPLKREWVRQVLYETQQIPGLKLGKTVFPVVQKSSKRGRFDTYFFDLDKFIDEMQMFYKLSVPKSELEEVFWDAISSS